MQVRPTPLDATAIVRRARRLRFRVKPGAVSQLAGAYHGARPGVGLTFAELRAYEPGDDVRHIDWNVTARQGRPFVRRFVEERALSLWLVVDVSASMRFGLERATKADRAAQAAALLATAAVQNGDRVGLVLVSDRIELELPPPAACDTSLSWSVPWSPLPPRPRVPSSASDWPAFVAPPGGPCSW